MAALDQAQVLNAAMAKIMKDGKELGFMVDVSYSVDYGLQDVAVIGQTTVVEHQQTRYIVSGEVRKYFIRDEIINPQNQLAPKTALEAIRQGAFDLQLVDKATGKVIEVLESCSLAGQSSGLQAGQLVMQRLTFRAINTRNSQSNSTNK